MKKRRSGSSRRRKATLVAAALAKPARSRGTEQRRWERLLLPGFVEHVRERVELHVFAPSTRILDAVRASSAVPVVFSPARVDGEEFVDLVHFGAIPARDLRVYRGHGVRRNAFVGLIGKMFDNRIIGRERRDWQ